MTAGETNLSSLRIGLAAAPGGLVLVQELVNTASASGRGWPDRLADADQANVWLQAAFREWATASGRDIPDLTISASELPTLRALRNRTRAMIAGDAGPNSASPSVVLRVVDGRMTVGPVGRGVEGIAGLVAAEILIAQHGSAWSRLKVCGNLVCGAAFFDLSRNGSRVWHDVTTCGNLVNLRRSRARRSVRATTSEGSDR